MHSDFAFQPSVRPIASLYPPRARATNVALIKALRAADSQQSFDRADAAAAAELHPSLLAELDWMEIAMPESQREGGRRLVDGFFVHHLPAILALRHAEFELAADELTREVAENIDFYRGALADDRQPLRALGEDVRMRVAAVAQTAAAPPPDAVERRCAALRPAVAALFDDIGDPDWVPLMVEREVRNALTWTLDHPSSRMRAKQWLRELGGQLPRLDAPSVATVQGLDLLRQQLRAWERSAAQKQLFDIASLCQVMAERLDESQAGDFRQFGGQLGMGYGPCGRCAMMYASTAIVSYDPTCPGLFVGTKGTIHMPLDFNVSVCPFCGEPARAEAPCLFYSPRRNQVIYNFPALGQFSEDEAREVHRSTVRALRDRFVARLNPDEAARFEAAREEITYSTAEFLLAVQMGTTVREHHAYNLIRLFDGRGLLVDPSKGVMLELTPAELTARWAAAPAPAAADGNAGEPLSAAAAGADEAMRAFAHGDAARARDILAPMLRSNPGDEITRKNLAAALLKLGDRDAARRVLLGDRQWTSKT